MSESLRESLQLWKRHYPWKHDFDRANEMFPAASYQYVLAGMGFVTESSPQFNTKENERAKQCFKENERSIEKWLANLPKHLDLLSQIHKYGLQPI